MRIGSDGLCRRICAGGDRFVASSSRAMVRLSVVAGREFESPALPLAFLRDFDFLRSARGKIHHAGKKPQSTRGVSKSEVELTACDPGTHSRVV